MFAQQGLAAPTALISKTAKVSEGSFFTYFATKDELINALYRELRLELAAAVLGDFPRKGNVRERLEHLFTRWVSWAVENPLARRALRQVSMSNAITQAVRAESGSIFAEIERIQLDAVAQKRLTHLPPAMASAALKALAEMTMELIERDPAHAKEFTAAGFHMLWGALTTKP